MYTYVYEYLFLVSVLQKKKKEVSFFQTKVGTIQNILIFLHQILSEEDTENFHGITINGKVM